MSNDDFRIMERPRTGVPLRPSSHALLYAIFGGAMLLAGVIGAFVAVFILRGPGQNLIAGAPAQARIGPRAAAGNVTGLQWATTGAFGSWLVRCQTTNGTPGKPCVALLQVVNQQSKQTMLAWIIGLDDKGAVQAVLQTPSGVNVRKGIEIKFGSGMPRHVDFSNCLPRECTAPTPVDAAFVKDLSTQQKANIVVVGANGRNLVFGIPVTGFDKALAAIKK
jgi:invasion protein IalB